MLVYICRITKTKIIMNIYQAGEFGKIKGNLQYLIRYCNDDFRKQTLQETKNMVENLYKELSK